MDKITQRPRSLQRTKYPKSKQNKIVQNNHPYKGSSQRPRSFGLPKPFLFHMDM
jgi:hypothetical protein